MVKKCLRLFVTGSVLLLLLTGCWDEVAIEERGFVIGTAVDYAGENEKGKPLLELTNQFVVPAGAGAPAQQGGGNVTPYMNISGIGTSMYAIDQRMAARTRKIPFFEHMKVLVISEDVAEKPFLLNSVLDIFIRSQEMRRGTKVILAKGEAKKILEVKPEEEKFPAIYIDKLLENSQQKTGIVTVNRVGDIHEYLLARNDYVLPLFSPSEERLLYEGSAVIHGGSNKLMGELNQENVLGLNLIKGNSDSGAFEVDVGDHIVTFTLDYNKSHMNVKVQGDNNVKVTIDIEVGGRISEVFGSEEKINYMSAQQAEKKVGSKVRKMAERTIEKAQNEMHSDIFQVDDIVRQRHYKTWQKIQHDWTSGDNLFSEVEFKVNVDARVQSTGTSEFYQYE